MAHALTIIGSLLGGIGMFILAISMMTDGLRQAAGSSLRKILSNWTDTAFKGVLSGFFMTALVQSSSAVTVASIGFVNAGLMSMRQALGIVYGANIGTTITGWLVAIIGFKLNIQVFALPLIGIGMILHLVKSEGKVAALGMALVGFGMFFVGIDVLKNAFEGLVSTYDISKFSAEGLTEIILCLFIGIVMTVLTQSSSAAVVLIITAATTGVLGIYVAAAMVIGANVGTTSTAVLASIGATANAKRVALAQVMFNVGTGVVALLILPLMFLITKSLSHVFGLSANPSITLALFHSIFNVLGVILIFPLNDRIASFLEKRFVPHNENIPWPKYLDKTLVSTPVLAINALVMELDSIALKVSSLSRLAVQSQKANTGNIHDELINVRNLSKEVSKFIVSLDRKILSEDVANQLTMLLRIEQHLLSCMNHASFIYEKKKMFVGKNIEITKQGINSLQDIVMQTLECHHADNIDLSQVRIQEKHDIVKAEILKSGVEGRLHFEVMLELIDFIGEHLRVTEQWLKALKHLHRLAMDTGSTLQGLTESNDFSIEKNTKINELENTTIN